MNWPPKFLPGTGRGTTKWWRGPTSGTPVWLIGGTPPSLRATSPFRGGFHLRALTYGRLRPVPWRDTNFLFSSREAARGS